MNKNNKGLVFESRTVTLSKKNIKKLEKEIEKSQNRLINIQEKINKSLPFVTEKTSQLKFSYL